MTDEIEKKNYYIILFDYYGSLFTAKQKELFESYYDEDYSLAEIAESFSISRNAVWDTLKKVCANLDYYESNLHIYESDEKRKKYLETLKSHVDDEGLEIIEKLLKEE